MTIKRVRRNPGGDDQYGDPIAGAAPKTTIPGAFVAPRTSTDVDNRGRQGVIIGLTLYAPYGTALLYTDQVEVDGELFTIEGDAGNWKSPFTSWEAGIEVALTRAAG